MKISQYVWRPAQGWVGPASPGPAADLVILFGARAALVDRQHIAKLREWQPKARLIGCSTAGEIYDNEVADGSLVATAVTFEHAAIQTASVDVTDARESFAIGEQLAAALPATATLPNGETNAPMTHLFVLSDGLNVNGSDLVRGLVLGLPGGVTVTGGLAGDSAQFCETVVLMDDRASCNSVAAVAFYGKRLKIGHGCLGGWDPFGPERVITRSAGNVLYELDGRSALQLYEHYLGEHGCELPASGLLFPLSIRSRTDGHSVVRTILAIDRERQSMTFAGDVPEGAYARLMKANFDRLIDGAVAAAETGRRSLGAQSPQLAVLISCVGRKLLLKQRIEEEVEGAREVLGPDVVFAGFYSYGEISPCLPGAKCELHNQTMTITTFAEA